MRKNKTYQSFLAMVRRAGDLANVAELLDWDVHTNMASGSMASRESQFMTLESMAHEVMTSPEYAKTLAGLEKEMLHADPDSDEARLLRLALRNFRKETLIPSKWVSQNASACARAGQLWLKAREKKNFSIFAPSLSELLDLRMKYVSFFGGKAHPLDVLLDNFDEGITCAEIDPLFRKLHLRQKKIIASAMKKPRIDDSFLRKGSFPANLQLALMRKVETMMGFDWNKGRQDRSEHPFTCSIGLHDVRITTKIIPGMPFSSLLSSIHECGHALYEQGIRKAYDGTFLGMGMSFAVHESQSRLWENLVGRSEEFWRFLFPVLKKQTYKSALSKVSFDDFMACFNKVEPSPVRTEADELTYNMHIILRYELEKKLFEGKLAVADLPDAWNAGMKELLGIEVKDDLEGVLQDVHWSMGEFGYFPSYALGNVLSAIFYAAALKAHPEIPSETAKGNLSPLREYLRENIHVYGAKYTTHELLKRITGASSYDPEPYLDMLEKRYA